MLVPCPSEPRYIVVHICGLRPSHNIALDTRGIWICNDDSSISLRLGFLGPVPFTLREV
jgi:hypothetical protein